MSAEVVHVYVSAFVDVQYLHIYTAPIALLTGRPEVRGAGCCNLVLASLTFSRMLRRYSSFECLQ